MALLKLIKIIFHLFSFNSIFFIFLKRNNTIQNNEIIDKNNFEIKLKKTFLYFKNFLYFLLLLFKF
jgi:hypothetical protein